MTLTPVPAPAMTSSGNPMPVVALPQRELLTVNEKDSASKPVLNVKKGAPVGEHRFPVIRPWLFFLRWIVPSILVVMAYFLGRDSLAKLQALVG